MRIWLDNHLSPALARWMSATFDVRCEQVRDLGLARATDAAIFAAASGSADAIITKDRDFAELAARLGPPPTIIIITFGNTSTPSLRGVLSDRLGDILDLVRNGERLIEVGPPRALTPPPESR
jgi:predicted nuclease of predicted toxin-antitoxin system